MILSKCLIGISSAAPSAARSPLRRTQVFTSLSIGLSSPCKPRRHVEFVNFFVNHRLGPVWARCKSAAFRISRRQCSGNQSGILLTRRRLLQGRDFHRIVNRRIHGCPVCPRAVRYVAEGARTRSRWFPAPLLRAHFRSGGCCRSASASSREPGRPELAKVVSGGGTRFDPAILLLTRSVGTKIHDREAGLAVLSLALTRSPPSPDSRTSSTDASWGGHTPRRRLMTHFAPCSVHPRVLLF